MAVYNLDFETIRQMMQAYQQTGFLSAEVPSGVMSLREPCRIEVDIMSGLITSCTVVGISGQRLAGKKTIQEISRLGRLNWTFTPRSEDVTQPQQSVVTAGEKVYRPTANNYTPGTEADAQPLPSAQGSLCTG